MTEPNTPAGAMPAAAGAMPAQTPPQDGSPAPGTRPPTPPPPATGEQGESLGDAGKKALDDERKARRDADTRAKKAEDELKKLQDAGKTEAEKKDLRLAELEREQATWQQQRQELVLSRAVERQAAKLGFIDPEDALALILGNRSAIEYEADGVTPKNVDVLLAALAKAKPHLIAKARQADFGGGDRGKSPGQGNTMNDLLRAAARGR
jgi:hypothetical protein